MLEIPSLHYISVIDISYYYFVKALHFMFQHVHFLFAISLNASTLYLSQDHMILVQRNGDGKYNEEYILIKIG